MKIKVYSSVDEHDGKKPAFEMDDKKDRFRVRITHDDEVYELNTYGGILELRHVEGRQLHIMPAECNMIRIEVMKTPPDNIGG